MDIPTTLQITLGESGQKFVSSYPRVVKISRQPAGLNFYAVDWDHSTPGKIIVQPGKHPLGINDVLHMSASEDMSFRPEGVVQIKITTELNNKEVIAHDEARIRIHSILDEIRALGWKTVIPRGGPRLRGMDMFNYALNHDEFTTLDSAYRPNLREWMTLRNSATWSFYLNNIYLDVSFARNSAPVDATKFGVYLLSFELKTEAENFRSDVPGKDRERWTEVIESELAKLGPMRTAEEAAMRKQGVEIDDTYVDPPLPKKR